MLVQKLQSIEKREGVKKSKKVSSGSGFSKLIGSADGNEEISAISEINTASSLFSLQELDVNDKITQEQNFSKTEETLNNLDKYQSSLLNNQQSSLDISALATSLSSRTRSSDANLESIIDEVELRAAVEAAKNENSL